MAADMEISAAIISKAKYWSLIIVSFPSGPVTFTTKSQTVVTPPQAGFIERIGPVAPWLA